MSLPTNELVYAGVWNVTTSYNKFQFVLSPTDNLCYAYVGEKVFIGGGDPATIQPSLIWIPFPVAAGTGIQSINGLTDPAMNMISSDASITIAPIAPDKVDFKAAAGFPVGHGGFISTISQPLTAGAKRYMVYDTTTSAVGCVLAVGTGGGLSAIRVLATGVYQITFSIQWDKFGGGGTNNVQAWFEVNGTPIPWSNSEIDITQQINQVTCVDIILSLNANDIVEIVGFTPLGSVDIQALANPIDATHPVAIPSIITDILRIS